MDNNQEPSLMNLFNQESTTQPPTTVPPTIPTQPPTTVPPTVPMVQVVLDDNNAVLNSSNNPNPTPHPMPTQSRIVGGSFVDDELLCEFVGGSPQKFSAGGFNTGAFFFGVTYYFYRKMILIGIVLYAVTILLALFLRSAIVGAIMELVMSFTASSTYYNFAVKKVQEIQNNHPGASREELVNLCRKAGGTSFLYAILSMILYAIFIVVLAFLIVMPNVLRYQSGINTINNTSKNRNKLVIETFESPFKKRDATTQDYFYYDENGVNRDCKMSLETTYYTKMDDALDYYQGYAHMLKAEKKNINGFTWYMILFDKGEISGIDRTHIYLTESDGTIYLFKGEFREGGPKDCMDYESEFLNHIQKKIS